MEDKNICAALRDFGDAITLVVARINFGLREVLAGVGFAGRALLDAGLRQSGNEIARVR